MSLRAALGGEAISGFKEGLPRRSFGAPRNDVNKVTYETSSGGTCLDQQFGNLDRVQRSPLAQLIARHKKC